jgi:hypothetical protein
MVPEIGLEPTRLSARASKTRVAAITPLRLYMTILVLPTRLELACPLQAAVFETAVSTVPPREDVVGDVRFELTISTSQMLRDTRLR